MKNRYYVTTAIDYVNAKPHVGHAVEKIQADVLARWHRDVLKDDTYFLTGSDDNSLKNVQSAKKAGKSTEEFIDENAKSFQGLKGMLNLSYNQFIRTAKKEHFAGAQKLWSSFKKEDIYKKNYKGLYCVGCEEFKMEKDLVDGKCPDHLTECEVVEEENYFFKLSNYQKKLEELIESDTLKIVPEYRKNEVLSFIRQGLEDFSISRSVKRAENWGVPVPGDEGQIMYVWVDALSNYITALGYENEGDLYKKYWLENENRVHVIGKGILRFHAIYWPAMLLSAGVSVPTQILSHEYLTINNQKISKTLGNIINPEEVVEKFGIDGARYVLLTSLPSSKDGDITWERMTEKYNADLANGLGNLTSRVIKLSQNLEFQIPDVKPDGKISEYLENFEIDRALEYVWMFVRKANKYIEDNKPWELKKADENRFKEVMEKLNSDLYIISQLLVPFLPETAEKIKKALETKKTEPLFQRIR
ncbi:MAG TPA: methionine--tRNA ligase [Candidatus Moranbacteria bacterium]|jgi:methionyl-tRNA synthetase|nr:methionine--tRNA ligase [Candidatus Moranbacteria bacterium]HPX94283.1 methionine--tRNA ligase [Candidatus Moranbacteria bacterium]HQB59734.1 methionine--tRNA ligase [Candidatus Moranbacteria bacterium]